MLRCFRPTASKFEDAEKQHAAAKAPCAELTAIPRQENGRLDTIAECDRQSLEAAILHQLQESERRHKKKLELKAALQASREAGRSISKQKGGSNSVSPTTQLASASQPLGLSDSALSAEKLPISDSASTSKDMAAYAALRPPRGAPHDSCGKVLIAPSSMTSSHSADSTQSSLARGNSCPLATANSAALSTSSGQGTGNLGASTSGQSSGQHSRAHASGSASVSAGASGSMGASGSIGASGNMGASGSMGVPSVQGGLNGSCLSAGASGMSSASNASSALNNSSVVGNSGIFLKPLPSVTEIHRLLCD